MEYYRKETKEVLSEFNVQTDKGLTAHEAEERLHKYGLNEIKKSKGPSIIKILINQFTSPLIWLLIGAVIISAALAEYVDAFVVLAIVILNAILGFFQEYKAERSIEALKKLAAPRSKVLRNGRMEEISSRYIVSGDIIFVETGDKCPADARLIDISNLQTQEAVLTGESTPVEKQVNIISKSAMVADQRNMIFAGTIVTRGRASAVVTTTGMSTEFGKIAEMLQQERETITPLQRKFAQIARWMSVVALVIIVVTFGLGALRGQPLLQILLVAISLAVAAVPEGLPAVITISLALGVQRMAKRNALIRKLPSAESLGSVSVICTDKTGTLTHNEMTVRNLWTHDHITRVTGSGYSSKGTFSINGTQIEPQKDRDIELMLRIGLLCNNTVVTHDNGTIKAIGDPTEAALIVSAEKAGISRAEMHKQYPRHVDIEFTSERKRMTTIHKVKGKEIAFTKGAVDVLLDLCDNIVINGRSERLSKQRKDHILQVNELFAGQALRVLGFAYKEIEPGAKIDNVEKDMIFVGLQAMIDPPRDEVKEALHKCREAQIDVVMITGDHLTTALAVGKEIGIEGKHCTGQELERMSTDDLRKKVEEIRIYARVNPAHKIKIVEAWQSKNRIVAMTGDGVNDAPALKKADIGIAMGITGTDVSKEASDMILTDDNFASIVNAIEEGRGVYDNIRKFFAFLFSGNIAEVAIIMLMILIGMPLPLTAALILLINLVTDGLPAIALAADPFEPHAMKSKPRDLNEPIHRGLSGFLVLYPIVMTVIVLSLFSYIYASSNDLIHAQAAAFMTIAFFEFGQAFAARSTKFSSFTVGIFKNRYLVCAVLISAVICFAVIYIPTLQKIFFSTDVYKPMLLSISEVIIIIALSTLGFLVIEADKFRRWRKKC
ncbi:MAG TPA: cation-translocating P-type ATPase [Candidatus Nanoarchaeia archaeon]|nr:cation-translocating P-type ATPase [Candidatus Nanoarchaeia archaeon]